MSMLNRPRGEGPEYNDLGQLEGGLSALEKLAQVVSTSSQMPTEGSQSLVEDSDVRPSKELPISAPSSVPSMMMSSPSFNSEDSFSGEGSDEELGYDTEQELSMCQDIISIGASSVPDSTPTTDGGALNASEIFAEARNNLRSHSRSREKNTQSVGHRFRNALLKAGILPVMLASLYIV
jgi:hypothetical protein